MELQRLQIKNRSLTEPHRVKGLLRADSVTYTGKVGETVKKNEFDVNIDAGGNGTVELDVTFDDYFKKLVDQVRTLFTLLVHTLRIKRNAAFFAFGMVTTYV